MLKNCRLYFIVLIDICEYVITVYKAGDIIIGISHALIILYCIFCGIYHITASLTCSRITSLSLINHVVSIILQMIEYVCVGFD